ncbi:hypothetical protein Gohar_027900 [Gossypium harknessii]|uniref:Uncharacterized protein n=1 Tax=Gossypium harknessii TaxID=34285 RepID=A0A7J9IB11_9ROSI|nr:hypothetical protein [Gossypium harknessii]
MGPHSQGQFNLLIWEPYATIFWVQFRIIFRRFDRDRLVTRHILRARE